MDENGPVSGAKSPPGGGAVFAVHLPLAEAQAAVNGP